MSVPNFTARYYRRWSDLYQKGISYPELLILHVAANYKLRPSGSGWWADGCEWPDHFVRIHSPSMIKSLLKRRLLEGNKETPLLWTSAAGKALLVRIAIETGLVFDRVNYQLVEPRQKEETDGLELGYFSGEKEAALAVDRAAILLKGDDAPTYFPSEESEGVIFSNQVIRQINAFKEGRGWLH